MEETYKLRSPILSLTGFNSNNDQSSGKKPLSQRRSFSPFYSSSTTTGNLNNVIVHNLTNTNQQTNKST
jgi:hypothetical protein